jgi:hypothetical protein
MTPRARFSPRLPGRLLGLFLLFCISPAGAGDAGDGHWEPVLHPPQTTDGDVIYDSRRHRLILITPDEVWAQELTPPFLWERFEPAGEAPARTYSSAVYDSVGDRVVVFCSLDRGQTSSVLFLHLAQGVRWEVAPLGPTRPPPGFTNITLHDPLRNRMLVFGDYADEAVWALSLDGSPAWARINTGAGARPGRRAFASGVYDPVRDRVLVFGGAGSLPRSDTWALSLSQPTGWSLITPAGLPPAPRQRHAAIHDSAGDRMIVYGGAVLGTRGWSRSTEAWALPLSGTPAWVPLNTGGPRPDDISSEMAAHDRRENRLVGISLGNQTLALDVDELQWTNLVPLPDGRGRHQIAYDAARDRMILAGGTDNTTSPYDRYPGDIWSLSMDHLAWERLPVTFTGREQAGLVIDAELQQAHLLFGSTDFYAGCHPLHDSWLPRCSSIIQSVPLDQGLPLTVARSFGCTGSSTTLDPIGKRIIVFGGYRMSYYCDHISHASYTYLNAFSMVPLRGPFDPAAPLVTGEPPPARQGHAAVYDELRDRLIVYGGIGAGGVLDDVWTFGLQGGSAWTRLVPEGTPPPPIIAPAAIYDPVRDRVVISGNPHDEGRTGRLRVWALRLADPPSWIELNPDGPLPPARTDHAVAYDPVRDRMVLFGGYGNGPYMNDVWTLNWGTPVIPVDLDFSPGDPLNRVDRLSQGLISAVVMSSDTFDALSIDPQTVTLGGAPVSRHADGRLMAAPVDLDADGRRDYCFSARIAEMDLEGARQVIVSGRTVSGQALRGRDLVHVGSGEGGSPDSVACADLVGIPALRVISPGPWRSTALVVVVGIRGDAPAELVLFDVAGRRVLARSLDAFGPGEHQVSIDAGDRLASGLYLLSLRQGAVQTAVKVLRVR